jgi:hypothetical protein
MMRRTIVVHTKLAGHNARVEAARANASGAQILTMDRRQAGRHPAAVSAGGHRPVDRWRSCGCSRGVCRVAHDRPLGELVIDR